MHMRVFNVYPKVPVTNVTLFFVIGVVVIGKYIMHQMTG